MTKWVKSYPFPLFKIYLFFLLSAAWPLMFDEFVEWIKDGEPEVAAEKDEEY